MLMGSAAADLVVCDVGSVIEPDAVVVDALARLQLTARRVGRDIRLGRASPQLQDLLMVMGLAEVLLPDEPDRAHPGD
jgi:hypothetical protein